MFPYFWLEDEAWARTRDGLVRDKAIVDEVTLFCDHMNTDYMGEALLHHYADTAASRLKELKALGFRSVGYNMLQTVGHGECGAPELEQPTYAPKMDESGKVGRTMPCMRDENFLKYIAHKYEVYAQAHPDFIWVDDDFRTNDTPIARGCFCDRCLTIFNEQNGSDFTREALVKVLETNDGNGKLWREKWSLFVRDAYVNIMTVVHDTVKAVDPNISLRLMVVHLPATSYYQNDYTEMANALGADAVRPGGGSFTEEFPQLFITKAYGVAHQLVNFMDVAERQYECEDWPQTYHKSAHYHILEGTAALMAGCTGTAFASIAPNDGQAYIMDELEKFGPVWDKLTELGKDYKLCGVSSPYFKKSNLCMTGHEYFLPILFDDQWKPMNLCRDGFASYTPYWENAAVNMFSANTIRGLSDEQIQKIFAKGVILDARAAQIFAEEGHGELIGLRSTSETLSAFAEKYTDHTLNGYAGNTYRYFYSPSTVVFDTMPGAQVLGMGVNVNFEPTEPTTYVYENKLGGRVLVSSMFVYDYNTTWQKQEQMTRLMDWLAKDRLPAKIENAQRVVTFCKKSDDGQNFMAMIINAFLDETPDNTVLRLDGEFRQTVKCVDRYANTTTIDRNDISYQDGFTDIRLPHLGAWGFVVLYTE